MHEHSYCRVIYNSKIPNATSVFNKKKMVKQIMAHLFNGNMREKRVGFPKA